MRRPCACPNNKHLLSPQKEVKAILWDESLWPCMFYCFIREGGTDLDNFQAVHSAVTAYLRSKR